MKLIDGESEGGVTKTYTQLQPDQMRKDPNYCAGQIKDSQFLYFCLEGFFHKNLHYNVICI